MDTTLKTMVWEQFGAAIDTLDDAINLCPDHLWTAVLWKDPENERFGQFWFVAYHAVFWIDLYLAGYNEGFLPPAPFVRGRLPDEPYSKDQVRAYLVECRKKCQATLAGLTDEQAHRRCTFEWIEASYLEMQLYCMRHVQEHAAQLHFVLGQQGIPGSDWITKARDITT